MPECHAEGSGTGSLEASWVADSVRSGGTGVMGGLEWEMGT